jgi:hypothetical protein
MPTAASASSRSAASKKLAAAAAAAAAAAGGSGCASAASSSSADERRPDSATDPAGAPAALLPAPNAERALADAASGLPNGADPTAPPAAAPLPRPLEPSRPPTGAKTRDVTKSRKRRAYHLGGATLMEPRSWVTDLTWRSRTFRME